MSMTILQGLKRIKHLDRKIEKAQGRVQRWCSFITPDEDPPQYELKPLMQSVNDLLEECGRIRHAIHRANIMHKITYNGKEISVDELLIRRTITIPSKISTMKMLRRKEIPYQQRSDKVELKVVLQYEPPKRDMTIDKLETEIDEIDALLDEINIILDIDQFS